MQYVSLKILGCELGVDECMSEDETRDKNFNFSLLRATPNILGDNSKVQPILYNSFINYHLNRREGRVGS